MKKREIPIKEISLAGRIYWNFLINSCRILCHVDTYTAVCVVYNLQSGIYYKNLGLRSKAVSHNFRLSELCIVG